MQKRLIIKYFIHSKSRHVFIEEVLELFIDEHFVDQPEDDGFIFFIQYGNQTWGFDHGPSQKAHLSNKNVVHYTKHYYASGQSVESKIGTATNLGPYQGNWLKRYFPTLDFETVRQKVGACLGKADASYNRLYSYSQIFSKTFCICCEEMPVISRCSSTLP